MLSVRVQTSELQATPWWTHRRATHIAGVCGKRFRSVCYWWADKGCMRHRFGGSGVPNLNKTDEYGTGSDSEDIGDQEYMEDIDVDALVMCVTIVLEGNDNGVLPGCVLDRNLCSFQLLSENVSRFLVRARFLPKILYSWSLFPRILKRGHLYGERVTALIAKLP